MNSTPEQNPHHCAVHCIGVLGNDYILHGNLTGNFALSGSIDIKRPQLWLRPFEIIGPHFQMNPRQPHHNNLGVKWKYPAREWCLSGTIDTNSLACGYIQNLWSQDNLKLMGGVQFVSQYPLSLSQSLLQPVLTCSQGFETYTLQWQPSKREIIGSFHRHFYKNHKYPKNAKNRYCSMATQVEFNTQNRESKFLVGMKMERSKWSYHGKLSTDGAVSVAYRRELKRGLSMTISGDIVHFQDQQPPMFGIAFSYSDQPTE